MYHYFISFNGYFHNGKLIFGMSETVFDEKIASFEEIREIVQSLEKDTGLLNITILNYQLIRDEKY